MRRTSWVVLLLSFSLSLCAPLFAQKYTGTITGVVTDPQGAVVSGAQVTAVNTSTGESRSATTGTSGNYSIPELAVGTYDVHVKAGSFKEYVSKGVPVDTSSTFTVNATLQIGAGNEQVTVEATTIQVETTNGAVGNVISGQEVRELPLNGNNFIQLTQLVPGVSALSSFNVVKKGLEGGVDFSVNGNNTTGNLFLVDGVNNNDVGSNRTILLYPSIQAIDEFKILRNSYGAEYGQASGAIISIVTRGGTNQFHGGVYYDGRNDILNATDYFNNRLGIKKDVVRRNDYGFHIGGPIIKDKLFIFESEEWNKEIRGAARSGLVPTAQERSGDFTDVPQQQVTVDPVKNTVTGLVNPSCQPFPAFPGDNIVNGVQVANTGFGGGTDRFYTANGKTFLVPYYGLDSAGNPIPNVIGANVGATAQTGPGLLSPFGLAYMGNYPLPNRVNRPGDCANWAQSFGAPDPWREDNVRADWHITKTLTLMGRYTRDSWAQPFPSTLQFWGEDIWPSVEDEWAQPSSQATLKLTKLLGSSAVNDFQVSFAANAINVTRQGTGTQPGSFFQGPAGVQPTPANIAAVTSSVAPNTYVVQLNNLSLPYFPVSAAPPNLGKALGINMGMPGFWAGGVSGIVGAQGLSGSAGGNVNIEGPWHNNEQLLILKDDFSKVFGSHTFKAGFIATNNQKNQRLQNESLGENGAYWSSTADSWGNGCEFWSGAPNNGQCPSSNGVFDILNQGTNWGWGEKSTDGFLFMRWHDYEFYGADNWKVRRNLTVDYGLRWSFLRTPYNGNGQMGWWEPNLFHANLAPNLIASPCNGMLLTKVGVADCNAAGLPGSTLGTVNGGLVPDKNTAIQPRIGIAWDVRGDGKTAVRAGFGTFYNRFMLNTAMNSPNNAPYTWTNPTSIGQRAFDNTIDPSLAAFNDAGGRGVAAFSFPAGVIGAAPSVGQAQSSNIPLTVQYNLTVERELANNTKLEVAYVGNRGRHLEQFINANAIPSSQTMVVNGVTLPTRVVFANCVTGPWCPTPNNGNSHQNCLTPFGSITSNYIGAAVGGPCDLNGSNSNNAWGNIPFGYFGANSNYDALQALFKTRIKVVDAQFAYTWSHSLSTSDITDSSGNQQAPNTLLDPEKRHGDYGNTTINRPSILVGSIVYNAPKMEGQNAFVRGALGAWETSAIVNYTSGPSLTVFAGSSGAPSGLVGTGFGNAERPNLVPGQSCKSSAGGLQWLNPAKFTLDHYAVGAEYPTSPRGICAGPGFAQTDFSIRKNFKVTERITAKFSMDFFNLFNKTQFRADQIGTGLSGSGGTDCIPATTVLAPCSNGYAPFTLQWSQSQVSSNFGKATGDRGPRQVQYGLKVDF